MVFSKKSKKQTPPKSGGTGMINKLKRVTD